MKSKQKRSRVTLRRDAAVKRIDDMVLLIEENVHFGLRVEAALQTANDIVASNAANAHFYGAACYNTVRHCMALNLALTLARLFEPGPKRFHPNKTDIASLPLLIRLLKQKRCRSVLVARARKWTPEFAEDAQAAGCERAIEGAIRAYACLRQTHEGRQAAETLKQFRDRRLAHSLVGTLLKALPQYQQLFLLMNVARDVTSRAALAVRGTNLDLMRFEEIRRREARTFWQPALGAAMTPTER